MSIYKLGDQYDIYFKSEEDLNIFKKSAVAVAIHSLQTKFMNDEVSLGFREILKITYNEEITSIDIPIYTFYKNMKSNNISIEELSSIKDTVPLFDYFEFTIEDVDNIFYLPKSSNVSKMYILHTGIYDAKNNTYLLYYAASMEEVNVIKQSIQDSLSALMYGFVDRVKTMDINSLVVDDPILTKFSFGSVVYLNGDLQVSYGDIDNIEYILLIVEDDVTFFTPKCPIEEVYATEDVFNKSIHNQVVEQIMKLL